MKKDLLNVDLISINCVNPQASVAAINYCQKFFNFGKSILVTHVEPSECYNIQSYINLKRRLIGVDIMIRC